MLDIAIEPYTGFPAKSSEVCSCPEGYGGFSCEVCARGYYRDNEDRTTNGLIGNCKHCECNGREISCSYEDKQMKCSCKEGYTGERCETATGMHTDRSNNMNIRRIACTKSMEFLNAFKPEKNSSLT